jgi:hypothetical protein
MSKTEKAAYDIVLIVLRRLRLPSRTLEPRSTLARTDSRADMLCPGARQNSMIVVGSATVQTILKPF